MKPTLKLASLAVLTAATLALPAAAAEVAGQTKCAPSEMAKCGAKCGPKCHAKNHHAKKAAKCGAKCGAKCAPKCAPKN